VLPAEAEGLTARHEQGQAGAPPQEVGNGGHRREKALETVEEQQAPPAFEMRLDDPGGILLRAFDQAERPSDRRDGFCRVGQRFQVDPDRPRIEGVAQPRGDLHGSPALADPPRSGERHDPGRACAEQVTHGCHEGLASHHRRERQGRTGPPVTGIFPPSAVTSPPPAGDRREEDGAFRGRQTQRAGERPQGMGIGTLALAAFQQPDSGDRQPGALGQLLLRQSCREAQSPQAAPEALF